MSAYLVTPRLLRQWTTSLWLYPGVLVTRVSVAGGGSLGGGALALWLSGYSRSLLVLLSRDLSRSIDPSISISVSVSISWLLPLLLLHAPPSLSASQLRERVADMLEKKETRYMPRDLRAKKTRAMRRALTPEQKSKMTTRATKKANYFPQRRFAVKA